MVSYRYTAEDSSGERVDGHVDATSVEEARRRLEEEGLRVLEVIQADSASAAVPVAEHLSHEEAQELVENVAQLSAAELPLAPGFRAAGDESDSPRLAQVFYSLADQLDQGCSLEDALEASPAALPAHVTRLIQAAIQTDQLGSALTELVEHYRDTGALRQTIRDGLAYPLVVAVLATVLLAAILAFVVGGFQEIYDDFGCELPVATKALLAFRGISGLLLPAVLIVLVFLMLLFRGRLGRAGWHRLAASIPVVGPL